MEVGMTCLASAFKTKKRLSQFGDGYRETEIRTLANHHGDMQSYEQRNKNFRRRPQRGKTLAMKSLTSCFGFVLLAVTVKGASEIRNHQN